MGRHSTKPRRARKRHIQVPAEAAEMTEITVTVPRDRIGMLRKYAKRISRLRPANREQVLWHLKRQARVLKDRFGIRSLALFGSVVRGEMRRESDVDLLVEFEDGYPAGMLEFVELKNWLEGVLSRPVDLVTPANIKPRIRDRILKEAVRVI
jgi:predicted nucleotidyltransferase